MTPEEPGASADVEHLTPAEAGRLAVLALDEDPLDDREGRMRVRQRCIDLANRSGDARLRIEALLHGMDMDSALARSEAGQAALRGAKQLAEQLQDPAYFAQCEVRAADLQASRGDFLESLVRLRHVVPLLAGHRRPARTLLDALHTLTFVYFQLQMLGHALDTTAELAQVAAGDGNALMARRATQLELMCKVARARSRHLPWSTDWPQDDPDVSSVVELGRRHVERFLAGQEKEDHVIRFQTFAALAQSGREAEAVALWKATEHLARVELDPYVMPYLSLFIEGPDRAIQMIEPLLASAPDRRPVHEAESLGALALAHLRKGNHAAAFAAVDRYVRVRGARSHQLAQVQAQLAARELETERERGLAQQALVHAGKLAAVGRLASSVAHELGQPAAAMMLLCHEARRCAAEGEQEGLAACLGDMDEQLKRLAKMVNRMKAFARDEPLLIGRFNLLGLVDESLRLCKPALRAAGVQWQLAVPEHLVVSADRERVVLGLVNLLNNAIDAMKGHVRAPRLLLRAVESPDSADLVRMDVVDSGPGLDGKTQQMLFRPFFTTKAAGQGLGLGLTITREALAGMGARLEACNEPGAGACFSIVLSKADHLPAPARTPGAQFAAD